MSLKTMFGGSAGAPEPTTDPAPEQEVRSEPQYVTKEEHAKTMEILQGLQTGLQTLANGFNAVAADRQPQTRQEPTVEDVTDDEIDDALARGQGAQTFRKMVNAGIERVKREVLGPELQAGYSAVVGLTREVAATKMPYYNRYQKEIDDYISGMTPQQQMNPVALKAAHDYVVGQHVTELLGEQQEAAARQQNQPKTAGTPGATGRQAGRQGQERHEFKFSEDNAAALDAKGYTPDMQAQRMGYKNWQDYMDRTQNINI